jgi:hypothetical protein
LNGHAVDAIAGKGISPAIAMLEHSCEPNCRFASAVDAKSQTVTVVLRALRPIAKDEPLSICYYSRNVPTAIRRQHLQTEYGFLCQCVRCTTGFDSCRAFVCPASSSCDGMGYHCLGCLRIPCDRCCNRPGVPARAWRRLLHVVSSVGCVCLLLHVPN